MSAPVRNVHECVCVCKCALRLFTSPPLIPDRVSTLCTEWEAVLTHGLYRAREKGNLIRYGDAWESHACRCLTKLTLIFLRAGLLRSNRKTQQVRLVFFFFFSPWTNALAPYIDAPGRPFTG